MEEIQKVMQTQRQLLPLVEWQRKNVNRLSEAADKRAYDLIKVLKYIIKGAGFELTERVQVKDTKTGRVYR